MSKPAKDSSPKIAELYALPTHQVADWKRAIAEQHCPFLNRKCTKNRKSEPEVTVGSCTVLYGTTQQRVMICPVRLLERRQIFHDCLHLLKQHEPGNELRIVAELSVPGGSVDYCLVSVREGKVKDFVGIELQTLDTTGTVWPERQRFARSKGIRVKKADADSDKSFGMNWKMTAKTILVQLHHKISTFEHLCKRFVLVVQDCLLAYMRTEFSFGHIRGVREGDPMHLHSYELKADATVYRLELKERISTDANGVATCLGLQTNAKIELNALLEQLESKLPASVLLTVGESLPVPASINTDADDES